MTTQKFGTDYQALAHAFFYNYSNKDWEGQSKKTYHPDAYGARRMFTKRNKIYSYGTHYCIARIIETKAEKIALFNENSNSKHTNLQKDIVRRACPFNIVEVSNPESIVNSIRIKFVDIESNIRASKTARSKKQDYLNGAVNCLSDIKTLLTLVKKKDIKLSKFERSLIANGLDIEDTDIIEAFDKHRKNKAAAKKRANTLAYKKAIAKEEVALGEWRKGERSRIVLNYTPKDYLRVSGEFIQTTQGINIEIPKAKKFYLCVTRTEEVRGCKLDDFVVKSFEDFLHIGCHKIDRSEIEEIASSLNWNNKE